MNDKNPTKKEVQECSNCIEAVFGEEYYNQCSCCILPILKQAGIKIEDSKAISQFFQCTKY